MNKRTRKTLSVCISLVILVLACTCSPSDPGEETPAPIGRDTPPPPPPNVLLEDDFSDPGSGWEEGEYDGGSVGYKNGVYFVTSIGTEYTMWGVANQFFSDTLIEVDATQVSAGPEDNNGYGVACRIQPNGTDGYYFVVSGDGYYAIGKAENEDLQALVDYTASSAVNEGNATNRIRAVCDGTTLTLFINGQRVDSVEDSSFTSGDIALHATSYEDVGTEIHFDNLVVRQP